MTGNHSDTRQSAVTLFQLSVEPESHKSQELFNFIDTVNGELTERPGEIEAEPNIAGKRIYLELLRAGRDECTGGSIQGNTE